MYTPSKSEKEIGETYFLKPPSEWKLIKFLKRKKHNTDAHINTSWEIEYSAYEDNIQRIYNDEVQQKVFQEFQVISMSIYIS